MSNGGLIMDWDGPTPALPPGVADIHFFRDYEEDSVSFGWVGPEDGRIAVADAFLRGATREETGDWEFVCRCFDLVEVERDLPGYLVWFQRRAFVTLTECDFCREPKAGVIPTYGNRRICPGCAEDR